MGRVVGEMAMFRQLDLVRLQMEQTGPRSSLKARFPVRRYALRERLCLLTMTEPSFASDRRDAGCRYPDHFASFPCRTSVPRKIPLPETVPATKMSPDGRASMP